MNWSTVYSIVPCCLAGLGILLTLTVISVFVMHNKSAVVKASGRELSYILLIGMLVCYSMTFVIIMKPGTVVCGIKRVGIGFGFAILYAALLVKTNRIYRIFSSAKRSAARPRWISPLSQVAITLILIGFQLVASGIWLFFKPPATKYAYPDPQPQAVLECQLDDHWFMMSLLYDAVLIIACTVYAVLTRQVPENFNEAKFIGMFF